MKRTWKRMTHAEADAIRQSDPEWVRQAAERAAKHQASVDKLQAEIKPEHDAVLADLASVGWRVTSLDDLVNTSASYPEAIPVLCKHFLIARHPVMRMVITRALTVKEARGIGGHLILAELKKPPEESPENVRWLLANALTVVADKTMTEDIKALLADPRYAYAHLVLAQTLRRLEGRKKPAP